MLLFFNEKLIGGFAKYYEPSNDDAIENKDIDGMGEISDTALWLYKHLVSIGSW